MFPIPEGSLSIWLGQVGFIQTSVLVFQVSHLIKRKFKSHTQTKSWPQTKPACYKDTIHSSTSAIPSSQPKI